MCNLVKCFEANNIVRSKRLELFGSLVDVRPFVNVYAQNRYFLRKNREAPPLNGTTPTPGMVEMFNKIAEDKENIAPSDNTNKK